MLCSKSGNVKYNHHALDNKKFPFSLRSSQAKPRKLSNASVKQNIPDLEKLIMDIKINRSEEDYSKTIEEVYLALGQLEKHQGIEDQLKTVSMLMHSIEKKIKSSTEITHRKRMDKNTKKDTLINTIKMSEISPIKQMDQNSSRIIYTNFSIKEFQGDQGYSVKKWKDNQEESHLKTPVSRFQTDEENNNMQIEKLNNEIEALERLLEQKTQKIKRK